MMTTLNYTITLISDWHIGSGLGAGAETDAEIIKTKDGLPYIPGKTIKGLLKDACKDITEVQPNKMSEKTITEIFGEQDSVTKATIAGSAFFSNATIAKTESDEITSNGLQEYLYKNVSSTAIGENGIANQGSLRTLEVCMPISLIGTIEINENHREALALAIKWVRHIGVNRNRGLGRCKLTLNEK
jgi:CRISPR/Cas system CSM-associated protein Csm3 (group 7 of RAMP superfamily)